VLLKSSPHKWIFRYANADTSRYKTYPHFELYTYIMNIRIYKELRFQKDIFSLLKMVCTQVIKMRILTQNIWRGRVRSGDEVTRSDVTGRGGWHRRRWCHWMRGMTSRGRKRKMTSQEVMSLDERDDITRVRNDSVWRCEAGGEWCGDGDDVNRRGKLRSAGCRKLRPCRWWLNIYVLTINWLSLQMIIFIWNVSETHALVSADNFWMRILPNNIVNFLHINNMNDTSEVPQIINVRHFCKCNRLFSEN